MSELTPQVPGSVDPCIVSFVRRVDKSNGVLEILGSIPVVDNTLFLDLSHSVKARAELSFLSFC